MSGCCMHRRSKIAIEKPLPAYLKQSNERTLQGSWRAQGLQQMFLHRISKMKSAEWDKLIYLCIIFESLVQLCKVPRCKDLNVTVII